MALVGIGGGWCLEAGHFSDGGRGDRQGVGDGAASEHRVAKIRVEHHGPVPQPIRALVAEGHRAVDDVNLAHRVDAETADVFDDRVAHRLEGDATRADVLGSGDGSGKLPQRLQLNMLRSGQDLV